MTTIAEFKKMLQEEIDEPLDYPRVPGLSAKELREYNEGYRDACAIVLMEEEATGEEWVRRNLEFAGERSSFYGDHTEPEKRGRGAAYTWALGELKGLEGETENPWDVIANWVGGTNTPAGALRNAIDKIETQKESQILSAIKTCFDASDNVMIPRARYNHLLEVERNAQEFVESLTRWEA